MNKSMSGQGRLFDLFLVLLMALVVILVIVSATSGSTGGSETQAMAEGSGTTNVEVSLSEWAIEGALTVSPGFVNLDVINEGTLEHNIVVEGRGRTSDLVAGDEETLRLGELSPGTYTILCDIPGHVSSGMETTLLVTEDPAAVTAGGEGGHGPGADGEEPDWEGLDEAMMNSMLAFPAETEGLGNIPLEPTIVEDGIKEFHLTTEITPWEVEPGKIVDAWTYNGMVPGPAIRVDVGDAVRVVVQNNLPMGTDIHWHGIQTPNNQDGVAPLTQPLIKSGETFTYEFVADRAAIGMYHAHHHGQMQVPNGLFGTFIIGDTPIPYGRTVSGVTIPEDLEIAREIPMVLNDAGVIGFSLNGKSFPATEPYVQNMGDWVVVHYYNEGLQAHPMHQHQFPQLIFAKDGIPLDYPYFADTINVTPGERYTVLIHLEDPGVWVWHCHILNHVEREEGMFGMVSAFIVNEE